MTGETSFVQLIGDIDKNDSNLFQKSKISNIRNVYFNSQSLCLFALKNIFLLFVLPKNVDINLTILTKMLNLSNIFVWHQGRRF